MSTINCLGKLIDLEIPRVMGILNLTPDSFYPGSRHNSAGSALEQAGQFISEGADFLDIGGYSSRPGAQDISQQEEADRVLPAIEAITKAHPEVPISIDTFRSSVARQALEAGAALINDISGAAASPDMLELAGKKNVPIILMHMRGTPRNMQQLTDYQDLIGEVLQYFSGLLDRAKKAGVNDCIVDPGFGFAKTREQNFELLAKLDQLKILGVPVLAGVSRKSMIYKTLEIAPEEALNGTTALHMAALERGARILRVHDPREASQCIQLWKELAR
ncbi:dihydropteroate synthase [Robiginitalea myxolifaciens]|uniref:dihydropteroate synthase n=1 Tax=Robiginitalea myxolifaciens TaxID=400055 RepID=A0A1I6HE61_9FLAO|nr:dihydropteroate synthase [Robiginitalea myxolifaciens]SFR52664.1 dihydropteroate synthase [Robiginitalea myxolifaciens]